MNLYVASAFSNLDAAQRFMDDAIEAGHAITHDWTRSEDALPDTELSLEQKRACAINDLELGVRRADRLIFLANDNRACGALIEFGMAAALSKVIYVIEPWRESVFWHLPNVLILESENIARLELGMRLWPEELAAA